MSLMTLATNALKTIDRINISLKDIFQDENDEYNLTTFFKILEHCTSRINEVNENLDQFSNSECEWECRSLWTEMSKHAKDIQFLLLSLDSDAGASLENKITELIESFSKGKFQLSQAAFLHYLSQEATIEDVLSDKATPELKNKAIKLFEILVSNKREKLTSHLSKFHFL